MRFARLPIAAALISIFNFVPLEVSASTLTVSNCNDSGTGSLRAAMLSAANNDVIDMAQLVCSTITLAASSGALLTAASAANVTLNGPIGNTLTIDGGRHDRVIRHLGSGTLALNDVTIMNGKYDPASGPADGGCIIAAAGSISLTRTHVSSCVTQTQGHGVCIDAHSVARLTNSTLSGCAGGIEAAKGRTVYLQDSSITNNAGGITAYDAYVQNSTVSGLATQGIYVFDYAKLDDSTISDNGSAGIHATGYDHCNYYGCYSGSNGDITIRSSLVAGNGKGGVVSNGGKIGIYASIIERNQGRGGITRAYRVDLTDSSVSDNAANEAAPDGIQRSSGGVDASVLNATRSTISGNLGEDAGGVLATTVTLVNTTVSANRAASGTQPIGGIKADTFASYNSTIAFNYGGAVGGIYATSGKIVSSIISGNNHSSTSYDRNLFVHDSATFSNNIITSSNVPTGAITADPKLTPLANHGGLVPAHALLATSPAIGAGSNPLNVDTDARGAGFARIVGGNPDIGAYERQADEDEIFGNGLDGS